LAFTSNDFPVHFDKFFRVKQSVKNLIIKDSKHNWWTTDALNLFNHIEETRYLTLINVILMGWGWDKLVQNLVTLEGIYFEGCTFNDDVVPAVIGTISKDKVIMLSIVDSSLRDIEPQALNWPNLKTITITGILNMLYVLNSFK